MTHAFADVPPGRGLVIDRGITLGHLKGRLIDFLRAFFGISDLPVRFGRRISFTEPSMESISAGRARPVNSARAGLA